LTRTNNIQKCKNCGKTLPENAAFCPKCGQKTSSSKTRIKDLLSDFFNNFFNLDIKLFHTLKALFYPGRLTKYYFDGKIKSFLSPWKLFLISILLMILVLGINRKISAITYENKIDKNPTESIFYNTSTSRSIKKEKEIEQDSAKKAILDSLRSIFPESIFNNFLDTNKLFENKTHYNSQFKKPEIKEIEQLKRLYFIYDSLIEVVDTLTSKILTKNKEKLTSDIKNTFIDSVTFFNGIKISKYDLKNLSYKQIKKKYFINENDKGYFNKTVDNLMFKINKNEFNSNTFIRFLISNLNWFIIILLPFAALIFKILYIRRKRYFVEHLVFNLHTHSAILLMIIIYTIIQWLKIEVLNNILEIVIILLPAIYIILAMKTYYNQSWFKTLIKFFVFSFLYMLILSFATIIYFVIAFVSI